MCQGSRKVASRSGCSRRSHLITGRLDGTAISTQPAWERGSRRYTVRVHRPKSSASEILISSHVFVRGTTLLSGRADETSLKSVSLFLTLLQLAYQNVIDSLNGMRRVMSEWTHNLLRKRGFQGRDSDVGRVETLPGEIRRNEGPN